MKKLCSIRLMAGIALLAAAVGICGGFFAKTVRNRNTYEKRIARLEQEVRELEDMQAEEKSVKESLNVVEPYEYVLLEERGYVAVYHTDKKTLYASTDILLQELPAELQKEIQAGKYVGSEEELYSFLENYSS